MTSPVRVGRPPRVSRRSIADAAVAVGFVDLSLAAVARRLGVSPASLHYHVGDRDGLVALAVDAALELTGWPGPSPDWRAYLHDCGWALWQCLADHPGLAEALSASAPRSRPPRRMYQRFEQSVQHVRSLGFTTTDALLAVDVVLDLAFDSSLRAGAFDALREAPSASPAGRAIAELQSATSDLVTDPELADALAAVLSEPGSAWFARKLAVVVAGVASLPSCPPDEPCPPDKPSPPGEPCPPGEPSPARSPAVPPGDQP